MTVKLLKSKLDRCLTFARQVRKDLCETVDGSFMWFTFTELKIKSLFRECSKLAELYTSVCLP